MAANWFYYVTILGLIALFQLCASNVMFYESFEEDFEGKWIVSDKDQYQGTWKHAKTEGHDDYGLVVSEKAKKYAIVRELNEPFDPNGRTTVLQFEIRLENGLECGGAYLKYLTPQDGGWKPEEFDNESPYSIMFGPDKCGSKNKVHFVLKHKNPRTGEFVEHHLKSPPRVPSDKLSHVYTAILKPNNDLVILIDGHQRKHANFLNRDDFEPPLIPPQTISDPDDKKPQDWDPKIGDEEVYSKARFSNRHWDTLVIKFPIVNPTRRGTCPLPFDNLNYKVTWKFKEILIPDYNVPDEPYVIHGKQKKHANILNRDDYEPHIIPEQTKNPKGEVVKPSDWDEAAPKKNGEGVQSESWFSNEHERTENPNPLKLEDWDNEENGVSCDTPMIEIPIVESAYRGTCHEPLVDNPNYKSTWKAKDIPNPDYYELDKPNIEIIAAIGIEIWTMGDGIVFDNILIATSEEEAETYREKAWKPKFEAEKENEKAKEPSDEYLPHNSMKLPDLFSGCKYAVNITRGEQGTAISLNISCRSRRTQDNENVLAHNSMCSYEMDVTLAYPGSSNLSLTISCGVFSCSYHRQFNI